MEFTSSYPNRLRVIPYQCYRGAENMAMDYYLTLFAAEFHQPVLRLYGWKPSCLSLGKHQNTTLIDRDRLSGIDFVRRPTGGSAIFHADELTYSFILPREQMGHHEMYTYFHEILAKALNELGYPVQLSASPLSDVYINKGTDTFACFNRSARSEIQYQGKKVVGSAQKIYKHAILQHGSIMLSNTHLNIVDYLQVDEEEKINQKKILVDHAISLSEISAMRIPSITAISESLVAGFESHGISRLNYKYPSPTEWSLSRKYRNQFLLT